MDPVDWNALLENCAGDEQLMNEVLRLFENESEQLLTDTRDAVQQQDLHAIHQTAHRLKGALLSLAATPSMEAARALEAAATRGEVANLERLFARLDAELGRLFTTVAAFDTRH